jgi:hypothetical protein
MNSIIVSPEYEKIKQEVDILKTELSVMILKLDELRFVICKDIEMNYMLELGDLEFKVFKAECTYLRCKRKLEMIQTKLNRQETIDLDSIDKQLDKEFEKYMEEINKKLEELNEAIYRNGCRYLCDEESSELKKLYRYIVKRIHPDMNPNLSEEFKKLFFNAVTAYKHGDLKTIRLIYRLIENEEFDSELTYYDYEDIKDNLEKSIEDIDVEIENVKSEFPYTVKDLLKNKKEIIKRREAFKEQLSKYEDSKQVINERINNLINQYNEKEARKWAS